MSVVRCGITVHACQMWTSALLPMLMETSLQAAPPQTLFALIKQTFRYDSFCDEFPHHHRQFPKEHHVEANLAE